MTAHEIEGGCEDTSAIIRVSRIIDAADVSVNLDAVEVERGIICIGGWLGITLVIQHADTGAASVGGVCVPFDAELMKVIHKSTKYCHGTSLSFPPGT